MHLIKRLKRLNSSGDTIVEVLIVLAVLSLAFAISTATATRGIQQSRTAEEHSQGLGILTTQIEQLRKAVTEEYKPVFEIGVNEPFCMVINQATGKISHIAFNPAPPDNHSTVPDNTADDVLENYPGGCRSNDLYSASIVRDDSGTFVIRVRWEGIGGLGPQQELMTYRTRELSITTPQQDIFGTEVAKITARAEAVVPDRNDFSYDSPPCETPTRVGLNGHTVNLTPVSTVGSAQTQTTSGGAATFLGITENAPYRISTTVPPYHTVCRADDNSTQLSKTEVAKGAKVVPFKFAPICRNESRSRLISELRHHHFEEWRTSWVPRDVWHYRTHQQGAFIQGGDAEWPWNVRDNQTAYGAGGSSKTYAFIWGDYWSWHHDTSYPKAVYTAWRYSEWTVVDEDWHETVYDPVPYLYVEDWDYIYQFWQNYQVKLCGNET
jgi:type II secretory pathway pseudopilin PulG